MKTTIMLSAAVLLMAGTANAQESFERSYEGPKASATQTVTIDEEAGTLDRDTVVTRKSDGATATKSVNRTKTETGSTRTAEVTNFNGETRTSDLTRTRTENGSTVTGTATGFKGQNYTVEGQRARTENGYTASQRVNDSAGNNVFARDVSATRENGRVNRQVSSSRPQGAKARPRRR